MLCPVICTSIVDARLTSPVVHQYSSPTPIILIICTRWRDTMWSPHLHPDMDVLGWVARCLMEWRKQSYYMKWCNCRDHSISSHSLRSWTRTSESNQWLTIVSTSAIAMASWLPLHHRLMGYLFWIELRNRLNTPSLTTVACWHWRPLGMHLGTMKRSGCHGTAAWHRSASRVW